MTTHRTRPQYTSPQYTSPQYTSPEEDSGRWDQIRLRPGDVVVSSRSKHGTTWLQQICLLLLHDTAHLPEPLAHLSPWVDWTGEPLPQLRDRLAAQPGRRVLKTHTPLDGIPLVPEVTYLVIARHPLDAAVSLHHQGANLNRARIAELTGHQDLSGPRPEVGTWLADWIAADAGSDPARDLDSLPGVMLHLTDAWSRRQLRGIELVHYADLLADLPGQMRRLAEVLGAETTERWSELVAAAGFDAMRARPDLTAPDHGGVLLDPAAFFRRGRSGAGREVVGPEGEAVYLDRVKDLAPADLLTWLHR